MPELTRSGLRLWLFAIRELEINHRSQQQKSDDYDNVQNPETWFADGEIFH